MKNRILRSVLVVAYIGIVLSGQLGSVPNNATAANVMQSAHTGVMPSGK